MILLKTLELIVDLLLVKPIEFYSSLENKKIISKANKVINNYLQLLNKKQLNQSSVYKTLTAIKQAVKGQQLNEVLFLQNFYNFLEIYSFNVRDKKTKQYLENLIQKTSLAKAQIFKYHVALDSLAEQASEMTKQEQRAADKKIIKEVGIFYILEYTLYTLFKLSQLDDKGDRKILFQGLKTKEANLPPYSEFAESFKTEFGYKIFDAKLRRQLLELFYNFDVVFKTNDLSAITEAFKELNLELLEAFRQQGIETLQFTILTPFGKEISITDLIQKAKAIKV